LFPFDSERKMTSIKRLRTSSWSHKRLHHYIFQNRVGSLKVRDRFQITQGTW